MTFEEYSDEMLLDLTRDSVEGAFAELYLRYWRKLYASARKRISSEDDAKDLIQELFVSLWVRRQDLPSDVNIAEYLYKALRYRIINYIQADKVRISYANAQLADMDPVSLPAAELHLASQELETLIEGVLESMPARMKEVFLLSYKNGFTPKEISLQLSLSVQTVKNNLTHARALLKGSLGNQNSELYALLLLACAGLVVS